MYDRLMYDTHMYTSTIGINYKQWLVQWDFVTKPAYYDDYCVIL